MNFNKKLLSYVTGLALGDGNLSNPNKRAIRLRITCDNKYPVLKTQIIKSLKQLFPENKVGIIKRSNCTDISVYSNKLKNVLGWKWNKGPKDKQNVSIPSWIKNDKEFIKKCLCGLFQTDGSIYKDRGYLMANFVNTSSLLANDVFESVNKLGYSANMQKLKQTNGKTKHTIRISKNTDEFIKEINYWKK